MSSSNPPQLSQQPDQPRPQYAQGGPVPPTPRPKKAGFFDISFTKFLSMSLIKIMWVLSIILIVLGALAAIIYGVTLLGDTGTNPTPTKENPYPVTDPDLTGRGVLIIVLAPLVAVVQLILTRIFLEMLAVVFRIEANTRRWAA